MATLTHDSRVHFSNDASSRFVGLNTTVANKNQFGIFDIEQKKFVFTTQDSVTVAEILDAYYPFNDPWRLHVTSLYLEGSNGVNTLLCANGTLIENANTGIDQNSGILWTSTNEYGNLSSIPVAVRDGYTFDGWYKLADDSTFWDVVGSNYFSELFTNLSGQKLTISTVNQDSATYVAKWVKTADTFTVTFDLNGATGTPPAPQKVEKGKTVTLPVLRASNAEFLGWGYSTDGRTLTEWKAEYPATSDLTLYAMWETESDDLLSGLTYRFRNYHAAFGYSASYQIPKERYELVFGKVQGNTVYNNILNKTWGGNCYGMAATSGMLFHGGGTTTSSFRTGAEVPYQVYTSDRNSTLNMNLTEYIEAVFVTQYADSIQKDYEVSANLNDLARTTEAVQSTKSPVMIAIRGEAFDDKGQSVNS